MGQQRASRDSPKQELTNPAGSYRDWSKSIEGRGSFCLGLENDSKIVVDALIGTSEAPIAIDNIIVGIKAKLQDFRSVEISHVKWDGNRLAHLLTQYTKYLNSY